MRIEECGCALKTRYLGKLIKATRFLKECKPAGWSAKQLVVKRGVLVRVSLH